MQDFNKSNLSLVDSIYLKHVIVNVGCSCGECSSDGQVAIVLYSESPVLSLEENQSQMVAMIIILTLTLETIQQCLCNVGKTLLMTTYILDTSYATVSQIEMLFIMSLPEFVFILGKSKFVHL